MNSLFFTDTASVYRSTITIEDGQEILSYELVTSLKCKVHSRKAVYIDGEYRVKKDNTTIISFLPLSDIRENDKLDIGGKKYIVEDIKIVDFISGFGNPIDANCKLL